MKSAYLSTLTPELSTVFILLFLYKRHTNVVYKSGCLFEMSFIFRCLKTKGNVINNELPWVDKISCNVLWYLGGYGVFICQGS